MKSISLALTGMMIAGVVGAADVAAPASPATETWITTFQHFAAQQHPQTENGQQLPWGDVLRKLPAPADWPQLRTAVTAAVARVPADQPLDRSRLQAASWLLAYLAGDRAALLVELNAAVEAAGPKEDNPRAYGLRQLRDSLAAPADAGPSPEQQVKDFEEQIMMLEPLDEAVVKQTVGGEENFARLKRLAGLVREMQVHALQLEQEYEANKDEAAARKKAEALEKEYEEKLKADQEVLLPYLQNPVVQHYFSNTLRDGSTEVPSNYLPSLSVPDLVPAVGRERAAALVRRALHVTAKLEPRSDMSKATRQLLQELALAEMAAVKAPSWGLVQDEHSSDLFEALRKKFPAEKAGDYQYRKACGFYLASLIELGRVDEAVKFAAELSTGGGAEKVDLPYEVMRQLEQAQPEALWKFLHAWLSASPGADEWDRFNRLSVQLDRRDELKALIKTMAASGAFNGLDRLKLQRMQADADMATGEITPAIERLRALVATPAATAQERSKQMEVVERLLKLADLQGDQAGYVSTLAAAEAVLARSREDKPENTLSATHDLISTLNDLEHYTDAVRIGRMAVGWFAEIEKQNDAKKGANAEPSYLSDYLFQDLPEELLRAEVELGHWTEAQALLRENPWWGTPDIAGLLGRTLSCRGKPVGYFVARTMQGAGDLPLTRRILEAQLGVSPGSDGVYATYLAVAGQDAMPLLEKMAAADRYEERPLIWKARLQMDAKHWDAAIATLQQAITIDPSDGEEGRGDRMRVYAYMSLAMAAKGDAEKAAFFANVVKAIRLSETADRWYEIGAYAKAIELYRQALGFFQDAYCIQSRLAIRLADAGKMDEAVEHYRRAFELMPDSFGRVESHCFGCEHVFAGKKSQGVADEVFARMLKARPDKPQLYYLTGYLREEQERLPEAAENYRHAVQLDPLYLNAWNRLADLDDKLKFTPAQRDDLLLKLAELDPMQRHVTPDLQKVTDLPRLWQMLQETHATLDALPPPSHALGELKASAARLAQAKEHNTPSWEPSRDRKDFAAILDQHSFVQALQVYLTTLDAPAEPDDKEPTPTPPPAQSKSL